MNPQVLLKHPTGCRMEKSCCSTGRSLYKIPVEGGHIEKLNTGFANRNNNDQCISFDGKMLAISHHSDGPGEVPPFMYFH